MSVRRRGVVAAEYDSNRLWNEDEAYRRHVGVVHANIGVNEAYPTWL